MLARALGGFNAVVAVMAVAPAVFTLAALRWSVPRAAAPMGRSATLVVGIAAVSYVAAYLVFAAVIGTTVIGGFAAAAIGSLVYVGLAAGAFPDAVATVLALFRRSPSPAA